MKTLVVHSKIHGEREILVDDEDWEKVSRHNWWVKSDGKRFYVITTIYLGGGRKNQKHTTKRLHRFLLDVDDPKVRVDHKNGNGLDNRKENLRICTNQQNIANSRNIRGGESKYKGVWFKKDQKRTKPWAANIKVNYKKISLGVYATEEEAALAYNEAAIKHFGEFANLNEV